MTKTINSDINTGILGSIRLGKRIQDEFPEVAKLYQNKNLRQIIEELDLLRYFGLNSFPYVKNALSYALRGYDGMIDNSLPCYLGLITDPKKLEELARKHNSESSKQLRKDKKGIFGLSEKEKLEICSAGGTIGGKQAKKLKLGIHGRNSEQKYDHGCLGAIASGYTLWKQKGDVLPNGIISEISEKDFVYWLSQQPENKSGKRKKLSKIAGIVNTVYHDGRSIRNLNSINCSMKKFKSKI